VVATRCALFEYFVFVYTLWSLRPMWMDYYWKFAFMDGDGNPMKNKLLHKKYIVHWGKLLAWWTPLGLDIHSPCPTLSDVTLVNKRRPRRLGNAGKRQRGEIVVTVENNHSIGFHYSWDYRMQLSKQSIKKATTTIPYKLEYWLSFLQNT
jgi:hypothetical protein